MEESILDESQKSEIVNDVYLNRILRVIRNITSSKRINEPKGCIMQFSDGKDSVNIYNKGNCYIVNLDGTNFSSLIGEKDGAYLYKNSMLDINYKLTEVSLTTGVDRRIISYNVKDIKGVTSFLANENAFYLIYMETSSDNTPKYVIYDEELVNLSIEELSRKIKQERNEINKANVETEQYEDDDKLPSNIADFDFSKYEDEEAERINREMESERHFLVYEEDIEEDVEEGVEEEDYYQSEEEAYEEDIRQNLGKIFEMEYEEECEQYKSIRCFKEDEEIEGEEKILCVQQTEFALESANDKFFDLSDIISEIISTYKTGLNKFNQKVAAEKSKINEEQHSEKNGTNSQEK